MANEIIASYTTGKTLYALIYNSVGLVWQTTTSTFVTYATANLANYVISLTQIGTAGTIYMGNMPAVPAGLYAVSIFNRAGASPAETDGPPVAGGSIDWDGTALVSVASRQKSLPGMTAIDGQIITGTATAGTANTITLAASASTTADYYKDGWVFITAGTGAGQPPRQITGYSTARVATVGPNWITTPDSTSAYLIVPQAGVDLGLWRQGVPAALASGGYLQSDHRSIGGMQVASGTAQGGTSTSITLHAGATAINDRFRDWLIVINAGTGIGQARRITAYNGTTKVATVDKTWDTTPDSTTGFWAVPGVGMDVSTIKEQTVTATSGVSFDALTLANSNIYSDTQTLLNRLTLARAGYLDNLNISGVVASSSQVTALYNMSRVSLDVPAQIVVPSSSTRSYAITARLYDADSGNMAVPDSAPTLTATLGDGTNATARLSAVTTISTGVYRWTYTSSSAHAINDQVRFDVVFSVNGQSTSQGASAVTVTTVQVDFTSSDRTILTGVQQYLIEQIPNIAGDATTAANAAQEAQSNTNAMVAGTLPVTLTSAYNRAKTTPTLQEIVEAVAVTGTGDGPFLVDHNFGGTDALKVELDNIGVAGASIRAYPAEDYDAGTYVAEAETQTVALGRWGEPMMLYPTDYVLVISKPQVMKAKIIRISVEGD